MQGLEELDRQLQRGSMFTMAALQRGSQRLGRTEAILEGVLDVLAAKGLVTPDELFGALEADDHDADDDPGNLGPDDEEGDGPTDPPVMPTIGWPTIALRQDAEDDVEAGEPTVDCDARLPVCQAVCCRLRFMLSAEEVDTGAVKWDIGHPYVIRHDSGGSCVHNDADTHGCSVYADRPAVCRRYDCTHDPRIWTDFEAMVLNEAWIAEHLGPRDISVTSVVPSMTTPVTITERPTRSSPARSCPTPS